MTETSQFVIDLFDHLQTHEVAGKYVPPEQAGQTSGLLGKRAFSMESISPLASTFPSASTDPPDPSAPIPQYTPTQSHPSFLHFPDHDSRAPPPPQPPFSAPNVRTQPFESGPKAVRNAKRPRKSEFCRDYHCARYCYRYLSRPRAVFSRA